MINKELLKLEIDKIPKEYLEVLYKIIKAFEAQNDTQSESIVSNKNKSWKTFVNSTYGSLSKYPIDRGSQGQYEIRDIIQ